MGQAARKVTAKNANQKLAHRRLRCSSWSSGWATSPRPAGVAGSTRISFYDWKRRFQLQGLDGLKDLPPISTT